jgi:hypothetical protein
MEKPMIINNLARLSKATSPHVSAALKAHTQLGKCLQSLHGLSDQQATKRARVVVGSRFKGVFLEQKQQQQQQQQQSRQQQQQQQGQQSAGALHYSEDHNGGGGGRRSNNNNSGGGDKEELFDNGDGGGSGGKEVGGLCGRRYRWSVVLATGIVSGFACSAGSDGCDRAGHRGRDCSCQIKNIVKEEEPGVYCT